MTAIRTGASGTAPEADDLEWWLEDDAAACARGACGAATTINTWQRWRRSAGRRYSELFAGHPDGDGVVSGSNLAGLPITQTRNVTRQGVLTVLPKVSKHRPMPQSLTDGGDWKAHKRARKMTDFLGGMYDKHAIFEEYWPLIVRDALVYGDGILKCEPVEDWTHTERVFWWELLIDAFDGRDGKPTTMYHVTTMPLGKAIERYGKLRKKDPNDTKEDADLRAAALRSASASAIDPNWDCEEQFSSTVKRVRLVHAYHLCDNERAHASLKTKKHDCTGRHVVCILNESTMLFDEVWDWDVFPFAITHAFDPLAGMRGTGLVRLLEGWQKRITNQADKVDDSHRVAGNTIVFCGSNMGVNKEQFTNDAAVSFVDFDGPQPPIATPLPLADPQVYQRERDMPVDALNEMGISMQSAGGQKHPGINAAVAIEAIDDIEDEHWVPFGRNAENWSMSVAKLMIRSASTIATRYGEYSIQVKMRDDSLIKIAWADVSMNDFQIRVFPSSVLPQQPSNRLQKLQTLFDAGIIDRQTFLQQLGAPDLNAEIDILTAMRINIDEKLEAVLDAETKDELRIAVNRALPNSYLDYEWMQMRAQLRIMQAETKGALAVNLDALRNICDACEKIKDDKAAKAAALGGPPALGMPPGAPSPGPMPPPPNMMPPGGAPPPPPPMPPMTPNMPVGNA